MADKPTVGILTFHKCINYGSYWQARCMAEGLRAWGHEAELIDHNCSDVAVAEWRNALQPKLPERSTRSEMRKYGRKARKFQRAFAELPLSVPVPLDRPEEISGYDVVLVGSDEVWNLAHPWYGDTPLFYGHKIHSPQLVSYAASFGSYSCHWGIDERRAEQLARFDNLSVRDENSYWLVRGSTGREAELVLDPCLLFPERIVSVDRRERGTYALVYGHSFPTWLIASLIQWSCSNGIRLVSVGYGNEFVDEQVLDAGPLEFAGLMSDAQCVITNYFHGCIFAMLNAKPFVTAASAYRQNKIRDLTALLAAEQRLVGEATPQERYEELLSSAPDRQMEQRLVGLRKKSERFLRKALS